jgi:glycosyltransferase involved in cell wall biosynthesis
MLYANVNSQKLVSIVLTTLNASSYLKKAVDSCLQQSYPNLELIVVDGGSSDGTLDILTEYDDTRIKIIQQMNNLGKLPGAINLGLKHANGAYLTWMQADCLYELSAISTMVDELEKHPDIGQVYADYYEINQTGEITKIHYTRAPEDFLNQLGDPAGVCFLIRRVVREIIGEHDIKAYPSQDYDYRMRIALKFKSKRIPIPLYYWRRHDNSLTEMFGWEELALTDIQIRINLGLDTPTISRARIAEVKIASAFEHYFSKQYKYVPSLVIDGINNNKNYLYNRGVLKIFLKSLILMILKHQSNG